jgi:hypothetical protein
MNKHAPGRQAVPERHDDFTLKVSKGLPQTKKDKEIFTPGWKLKSPWTWRYDYVDYMCSDTYNFSNKHTGESYYALQLAGERGHEFEMVERGVYRKIERPIQNSHPRLH